MDHNGRSASKGRETYLAVMLCVLIGLPIFVFFNVLTGGLFILLLVLMGGVAVLGAFNYFLWGRSLDQEVADERRQEEGGGPAENRLAHEPQDSSHF